MNAYGFTREIPDAHALVPSKNNSRLHIWLPWWLHPHSWEPMWWELRCIHGAPAPQDLSFGVRSPHLDMGPVALRPILAYPTTGYAYALPPVHSAVPGLPGQTPTPIISNFSGVTRGGPVLATHSNELMRLSTL